MPVSARAIAPGPGFWPQLARVLLTAVDTDADQAPGAGERPLSEWLVMVPTFTHIGALRAALATQLGSSFIPPQIRTLSSWLEQQLPEPGNAGPATPSERLMGLYAQLREIGWLKSLLATRRNTDLLPLAQTLLSLNDELSAALLPSALAQPDEVEDRWRAALAQLSPRAAALLSNEAHLVWSLWQGERDARDPGLARHNAMQRAAAAAEYPLLWCAPWEPDALEAAFLDAWSQRQPVLRVRVDWSADALPTLHAQSWPEILDAGLAEAAPPALPAGLKLYPARSMEDEAQAAAQTIVDWIAAGKKRIALVPQDRVVARRLRALLERADIVVSDETGWKLSTTRAAAVIHAWMELVSAGGEIAPLLDFLKSPFVRHPALDEPASRHALERALVKLGHSGSWASVAQAVASLPELKSLVDAIAREAQAYRVKKSVADWVAATMQVFDAIGCSATLATDKAGEQLLQMLSRLASDCEGLDHGFSLAEWRVLLDLELEQTVFVAPCEDRRVMMVPLNGTMLREFDAAIVVGADSEHLPSRPAEALFFANAVRRELGLATREDKQRQQLREFAALLITCPEVVLSWQQIQDGEKVAASPWIQRLQLSLHRAGLGELPVHEPQRALAELASALPVQPHPAAPQLIPATLSASGYDALVDCPYQFFATRMLGLRAADPLRELPEKRDYGDWLHAILKQYHDSLRDAPLPPAERKALMTSISDAVFDAVLANNPAALSWQARWQARRDAYVDWANEQEAEGWTYRHGEEQANKTLNFGDHSIRLFGELDRIDANSDGEQRVLDYKTTAKDTLSRRLKECDDHQLPFYSLLLEPHPVAAGYVAIDDETTELLPVKQLNQWREALRDQLQDNLAEIAGGASLAANGNAGSCTYCDMNGLCRKGFW
jgi:ATP-dependent helicase/nuclease subunit B